MWFQVSAVSQLGNGRCGDQDGGLYDGEIPGGAEIHETEEEATHLNLSQERRKYVDYRNQIAA